MRPLTRWSIAVSLSLISFAGLLAQAEGESPYSSSTVDSPPGDFWATNGLIIAVAVVFFGLLIFLVLKGRRRA